MRIGVLILAMTTMAFLVWLSITGGVPRAVIEVDPRRDAYTDPRRVLARIQSDLERTAGGHQSWPLPPGVTGDPLEAIVDAFRLYLDGNAKGMDARLKEIVAEAQGRLASAQAAAADADAEATNRATTYFDRLTTAIGGVSPTARMVAGLRLVDGVLFMEAARWANADPATRRVVVAGPVADPLTGTWLRLPCRTVIGRVAALREAQGALGDLTGPLLSCPSDNGDLAVQEAQARAPAMLPARVPPIPSRPGLPRTEPSAPPTPWDRETAVAWMDDDPDAAEPVLATLASPADRLDYALFLHAFRPAGPDNQARIHALMRAVDEAALATAPPPLLDAVGAPATYDGGDASLVPSLRLATATGVAAGYAIPCAVLQARPALLAATESATGTRDVALPASGCASGRGQIHGFPEAEVAAYVAAAQDADGHFLDRRGEPAATALATSQKAALELLKLAPRDLAAAEPPGQDHPYQTWGLLSVGNRVVELRVLAAYREAEAKLSAWYTRQGLSADEAGRAAKTGLFRIVWGAECGGGAPTPSLRGLLLDKAPAAQLRETLAGKEAPEVNLCAATAGIDPLPLAAVGHPAGLALLLDKGWKADERNAFGKTALMVAAQFDQIDSVRLLLDKGAAVNATTWKQDGPGLAHDGRTALMYAAAQGSLPVIKLLLDRGADPHLADTKGRRAIDYLLGFGPTNANPRLGADERAEAARLLF